MTRFSLFAPTEVRTAPSLHRRFIVGAGVGGTIAVVLLGIAVQRLLHRQITNESDTHITEAAQRALVTVSEEVDGRSRLVRLAALTPEVISAARLGGERAQALGIVGADIAALEKRFEGPRSLDVSASTRGYLTTALESLDGVAVMLTDANGYTAVSTRRTTDFVQSDEDWWRIAWRDGVS